MVELKLVSPAGGGPTSEPATLLEDTDRHSGIGEESSRSEAGDASTDDGNRAFRAGLNDP
jgi:hypothetical protein